MIVQIKDTKHRHGNCVPFTLVNGKTGTLLFKGSLNEVAKQLKITAGYASVLHISGKPYKKVYYIQRVGFEVVKVC